MIECLLRVVNTAWISTSKDSLAYFNWGWDTNSQAHDSQMRGIMSKAGQTGLQWMGNHLPPSAHPHASSVTCRHVSPEARSTGSSNSTRNLDVLCEIASVWSNRVISHHPILPPPMPIRPAPAAKSKVSLCIALLPPAPLVSNYTSLWQRVEIREKGRPRIQLGIGSTCSLSQPGPGGSEQTVCWQPTGKGVGSFSSSQPNLS